MIFKVNIRLAMILLSLSIFSGCQLTPQPGSYFISETEVSWITTGTLNSNTLVYEELPDANVEKFRILSDKFGADDEHVFYSGIPIPFADGKTFRVLSEYYGADKQSVFFKGNILKGASPEEIKVLSEKFLGSYAKDSNRAYFNYLPFSLCHAESFHIDKSHTAWAMDNQCVYYEGISFVPEDIDTFETISSWYAKDALKVYYEGRIVEGADPESFELVYRNYSIDGRDKFGCYKDDKKIDCNTTKRNGIYSGVDFNSIGTKDGFSNAVNTMVNNLQSAKKTRKELAEENSDSVRVAIVDKLGENIFTPSSSLNQNQITSDFDYKLISRVSGKSFTYIVKNVDNNGVKLNVYIPKSNKIMNVIYNSNGKLTSEFEDVGSFSYSKDYVSEKCEKKVGQCEEKYYSDDKIISRNIDVRYNDGVWERRNTINGHLIQEFRIYDKFGFEVYFSSYYKNKLEDEFIREGYRPEVK